MIDLRHGDCLEMVPLIESDSLDSIVTDPPAGISFMGKEWDHNKGGRDEWIKWMSEVMIEAKRTLKPGGHALVWALPRTSHWTGMALENAGFEVRDCVYHIFGSGFPKSLDIGKAIDKQAGVEREILGKRKHPTLKDTSKVEEQANAAHGNNSWKREWDITSAKTEEAKQWEGWGTALKPAVECWWLVRKPISENTIAQNVLKHSTGGLAINECRVISDKIYNLLDYAKKINEYVLSVSDENKSYKDHAHNEFSFHRNFDKLYSFSVDGAYHLADYEELNVQNPFYQKLLNFLGGCPVCFHLYDALVHLLSGIDLLTSSN